MSTTGETAPAVSGQAEPATHDDADPRSESAEVQNSGAPRSQGPPNESHGSPDSGGATGSAERQEQDSPDPPPVESEPPVPDEPFGEAKPKYVIGTTVFCLLFAVFGHLILWIAYSSGSNDARQEAGLPPIAVWEAAVGVSIVGVALIAFGGFYAATLRARIAIASSFMLTFLVILSFALTIRGFAAATVGDASELLGDFRAIVISVAGFYFGSEAVVSAVKVYGVATSGGTPRDIVRADRDLPVDRSGTPRTLSARRRMSH
jgi:hypothetical protein